MKLSTNNFLTSIKNIIMGGGRNTDGTPKGDAGFLVSRAMNLTSLTTAAGLTLTASTVPAILLTETNGMTVAIAASETAGGSFTFQIPRDYDEATDELKIRLVAGMDGATDSPTMDATVYRKKAGVALSADLNPTASSALGEATAWKTIDVTGEGLVRDDILTINLVSGAHTTNAVSIHAVELVYRSTLVSYDLTDGANNNTGTNLR